MKYILTRRVWKYWIPVEVSPGRVAVLSENEALDARAADKAKRVDFGAPPRTARPIGELAAEDISVADAIRAAYAFGGAYPSLVYLGDGLVPIAPPEAPLHHAIIRGKRKVTLRRG